MKKFFKVYSGPGYPVDPALEIERLNVTEIPQFKMDIEHCNAVAQTWMEDPDEIVFST